VIIETPRLRLRPWTAADRAPFAAMGADPAVMRYFPSLNTAEQSDAMVTRIEAHFAQHGFGFWAAELKATGEFAGVVGLAVPSFTAPFTPCVEIGWRLAERYWNQGLATEGATAVLRFAFDTLGLTEVVAYTVPDNVPSRRVMEKLRMTHAPRDDFDHPNIPPGHPLRRHVLYRTRGPRA
jgi:RimJ/RimL family protein N-acetyltransferase